MLTLRSLTPLLLISTLTACASTNSQNTQQPTLRQPQTLQIGPQSDAHQTIIGMPPEAVMERFEMTDSQGTLLHYVALTEGEPGALLFRAGHLAGSLSRRDAQLFYSCRGYATATGKYWGKDSSAWMDTLSNQARPVTEVTLQFSGKSTLHSIVEVVNNPSLSQLGSLVDLGSNPLGIFRKLNSARDSFIENERFQQNFAKLRAIRTGASESQLAEIIKPEDLSFTNGGVVMGYPHYLLEYFVSNGTVKLIQQPAFSFLSRTQPALFYTANTRWELCNPAGWPKAMADAAPESK